MTLAQVEASLQLRPEGFVDHLTQQLGFKLVDTPRPAGGSERGFDRPIYLLQKPEAGPTAPTAAAAPTAAEVSAAPDVLSCDA